MKLSNHLSILGAFALLFLVSCDNNHKKEFYDINRDDIKGYEAFIRNYPQSIYVQDAKERIETALQEERNREYDLLVSKYGNNALSNGAEPYSRWYGSNKFYDDYTPHSEIRIQAPSNSDVIAIVRYNNSNGKVAGHKYIRSGCSSTIYLENDHEYQTFFYYGNGWYPEKEMKNSIFGGFVKGESYSKDGTSSYLDNNILTYELTLQTNGNFQTSTSSEGEMF